MNRVADKLINTASGFIRAACRRAAAFRFWMSIILLALLCGLTLHSAWAGPPAGYYLVWGDEFNGTSLDTTKWDYWVDNRTWGKAYNDGAVAVSVTNGCLVITSKHISGTTYPAMVPPTTTSAPATAITKPASTGGT